MRKLLLATLLGCATCAQAQERLEMFYGYAYELASGRFLYTEIHKRKYAGGRWITGETRYITADGSELGRKSLDFSADPFIPLYRLDEQGYVEAITSAGDPIEMTVQEKGGKPETGTVKRNGPMASDSGFTNLLLAHFDELMRGDTIRFRIVAVSRGDSFKFKATRVADATFDGKPAACMQSEIDSMLKLFAGPLRFCFDAASRKLVEFRGPTNVRDPATGKPYDVRIAYTGPAPKEAGKAPPLSLP